MDKNQHRISILGAGWLGLPLAIRLKEDGYNVKASTTSPDKLDVLSGYGIQPFLLKLVPDMQNISILEDFLDTDLLLINIPPGTKKDPDNEAHILQMKLLVQKLRQRPVARIIYVSSTSVYADRDGEAIREDESVQVGNRVLFEAEEIVRSLDTNYCILRMGGLTGYDRNLVRFFAGKKDLKGGESPVNLIHRDDCMGIIASLIGTDSREVWNETYNCCSPVHPLRKDFYTGLARRFELPLPEFISGDRSGWKMISPDKLISRLGYWYIFPDPMFYTYEINT